MVVVRLHLGAVQHAGHNRKPVVALDDLYGGTQRLFEKVRRRSANLDFTYSPMTSREDLLAALRPDTRMIWVETPTNPLLSIADISAIAEIGQKAGAKILVDNTFASPALQQPLTLGADIVLHSTTKYIGGHSDLLRDHESLRDPPIER